MDQRNALGAERRRLLHAVLVFPLAGLVGFGGSLTVRSVLAHLKPAPAAIAPRPADADSDRHPQPERPARRTKTSDRPQTA